MEIRKWLPVVEYYVETCNDGNYLRIQSSFLHGKPRSYFQSKYDAHKAANGGAKPANRRKFFRETIINRYGRSDQTQVYWDNWINLRMLANMDTSNYNVHRKKPKVPSISLELPPAVASLCTALSADHISHRCRAVPVVCRSFFPLDASYCRTFYPALDKCRTSVQQQLNRQLVGT
jgi:hypothetical protein